MNNTTEIKSSFHTESGLKEEDGFADHVDIMARLLLCLKKVLQEARLKANESKRKFMVETRRSAPNEE